MAKVSLRAYNHEIEAMIDRGHLDEAIAHCQHILKKFPKHLETYRLLGKSYLEAKRHTEAVDIFSRVLVAEPSDFVAQVGMSIIRDEQNKLDDAIWHMERAFETQPSNAAIQGELQRLYGRRDGSQPPRIRMTRGALAHMYMQGELYPQAISETKNVLEEDQGRSDMQALLAKAYFKSGQKNDAADAASIVLKRYPFCLDANRVLTEVLGSDRPESAEIYRKRVFELDPYASQVDGSVFQSAEVSDAAVTLEHLDWNGQSTGMPSDWRSTSAISLESGSTDEQPDWLKNALPETTSAPPPAAAFVPEEEALPSPDTDSPAQPAEDIPDFLRAAGWGESTGTFDESASSIMFDDAPDSEAQPLEQGDMPDWVKAMAPQETPESAEEEEIPDWINKIGTGELPVPSVESSTDDQPDWLNQPVETSVPEMEAADDQPDWLKGTGSEEQPAPEASDETDWLGKLGEEAEIAAPDQPIDDMDLLNSLESGEPEQAEPAVPSSEERSVMPDTENLGMGEQEQDDSFAWLENLAAKQGATEGLLTKPEERLEEEPDWVKQAKGLTESEAPPSEQELPPAPELQSANVEDLGKSDEERDDSFAWLENLAAKQGATEGLLTRPEDRFEEEPEWVKQAKNSEASKPSIQETPEQTMEPVLQPIEADSESAVEEPESIQDNIESVEQPLEVDEEPIAASMGDPEQNVAQAPESFEPVEDVAAWLDGLDKEEPVKQAASESDDETAAWLKTLDEPDESTVVIESDVLAGEAVEESDDLPDWLSGLDEEETKAPAFPASDDLPAWMRDDTGELVAEPTKIEPTQPTDWTSEVQEKVEEEDEVESQPPPAPATPAPAPVSVQEEPEPTPMPEPVQKPAPKKKEIKPAAPPEPYKEPVTRKTTGVLEMPIDPVLGSARAELNRSNIPGALETYGKLIKKGRFLEEVIYDLRDALYRYPVEVSIWQSLGDAYMRANQLQDALDAYTKAEELLR
jgi:tetratricopeptide (TPR) repeat protein